MTTKFDPYLTAPSASDKNWIHYSCGGYNYCIRIKGNSCLPNCVGYAWGEWRKRLGQSPRLSLGEASLWWGHKDGYSRTQFPRLGSVICFDDGGSGHVGIVEAYDQRTGEITVAQSGYFSKRRFFITKLMPPYNWNQYKCSGFIHLPNSEPLPKAGTPMEKRITHIPSMYTMREPKTTLQIRPQMNDGSKPAFTYGSSDTKVATIDKAGKITAVGAGTATITVKAGGVSKTFPVTVPKLKTWNEIVKPVQDACIAQAKQMANYTYKWLGASGQTIAESKKYGTCVTYTNCVLYRVGILKEKEYIYQDENGNITYNGATKTLREDCKARAKKYLVVNRIKNVRPIKLKGTLRKGDILMYTKGSIKAGGGNHICIFSGQWDGEKAVVWDNDWAGHKMKRKSLFDKPLDSYIRIRWFKVRTECDNGVISLSNNYLAGETVKVKYTGKTALKSVTVDGKKVDIKRYPKEYVFAGIKADHTIKVVFG